MAGGQEAAEAGQEEGEREDEERALHAADVVGHGAEEEKIFAGMIPKLDNAFAALKSGVNKVIIGKAENLEEMIAGSSGTTIVNE